MERDVASVAAVIKLSAVEQAGSPASLMSVCSVALWSAPEEKANDGGGLSSLCFCPLWRVNHRPVNSQTPQPNPH